MVRYKSRTYIALVWLSKTWLPVILLVCSGISLATHIDVVLIGTFVSGALIPALNLVCRNAKHAALDPHWHDIGDI